MYVWLVLVQELFYNIQLRYVTLRNEQLHDIQLRYNCIKSYDHYRHNTISTHSYYVSAKTHDVMVIISLLRSYHITVIFIQFYHDTSTWIWIYRHISINLLRFESQQIDSLSLYLWFATIQMIVITRGISQPNGAKYFILVIPDPLWNAVKTREWR